VKFESFSFVVKDVVFYESVLRYEGPIYKPLKKYELGR